jgi:phosphate-selective porin OprO/OprP
MLYRAERTIAVASALLTAATRVAAQENDTARHASAAVALPASSVEERLAELDQQIRILKRLQELERDSVAEHARSGTAVTSGGKGFLISSADGVFQLRIGGNVQADGRVYPSDGTLALGNAFVLRRVRPSIDATVYRIFDARLMTDFAESRVQLFDAYVGARVLPGLHVRAGKLKGPIGLERLQSQTDLLFIERALPTGVAPNREVGLTVGGELLEGMLRYDVGLFDGSVDGASTDGDVGDNKDVHARLFARPFARSRGLLTGLGVGIAGTLGEERGSPSAPALASYRSEGQQLFFVYRSDGTPTGSAYADGRRTRISPQASYYRGALGLLGEWIRSSQIVNRTGTLSPIRATAWQATGSFALTGEQASYTGLDPRRGVTAGGLGALELVARYGELRISDEAFPVFADPARSARRATEWGVGFNWYLERRVKVAANYIRTAYDGGSAIGDRDTEHAILTRFQVAF